MAKEFVPTEHPVYPIPTPVQAAEMGMERWREFHRRREELIVREKADPFRYGYEPPVWKLADEQLRYVREILILGGNRGSKSDYAAKRVMQILAGKEGARGWCFQSSEANSREMQQPILWKYMPPEWRSLKKGRVVNISYTQKNGFSDNTFVLPNASQCWFRNYSQDEDKIEGGELDVIWADELVPESMLETLRYRLVTRGGLLLVTFTPVEGWNATVKSYLQGAQVLEEVEAELLPILGPEGEVVAYEKVPRLMQPQRKGARIVFFHTKDNPFGGYVNIRQTLEGADRNTILMRAYGFPTKAIANRFPKFGKVHVVAPERVPVAAEGTDYLIVDPCGGRNWFMGWFRVDVRGRIFMVMEWPCESFYVEGVGLPGPWAVPDGKKHDGRRGTAQNPFGFGLKRYKEEIERVEKQMKIGPVFERRMDSRYGNSSTVAKERPTTLIEECEEIGLSFIPTPGENIDEGVDLINDLLDYDTEKEVGLGNEPMLYISEQCTNMIFALQEWTGLDGRHGASKDPIDILRYAVLSRIEYAGGDRLRVVGGGSY